VSFGQRSQLQNTTQLTPLSQLIDAARPDPWSRSQLNRQARKVVADPKGAKAERDELTRIFSSWKPLEASVAALADSMPLAKDGIAAARALHQLGDLGLEALSYLDTPAPADWKTRAKAALDELAKPQGLLRLAGIDAVRTLIGQP
jgi:hypothetical protein